MTRRGVLRRAYLADGRVLCDVTLANGEVRTALEYPLPPGVTAIPPAGADVLVSAVRGRLDDLVVLSADTGASRVTEAVPGDYAVRAHGATVLITAAGIAISGAPLITLTATDRVVVEAPEILLGAGATKAVKLADDTAATKVKAE